MGLAIKWRVLAVLLLVYVTNQWSRYSIVYLAATPIRDCPAKGDADVCHVSGNVKAPLCKTDECESDQCKACQDCLDAAEADKYNLKYATCLTSSQYGILVSYGYIVVFGLMGLVAGRAADVANRRNLIFVASLGWGGFTLLQTVSTNYTLLLLSRLGMGFCHAFSGPASLSIIADLFGPLERGKANGIYTFGIYVGGGLSSLTLLVANASGWRFASGVVSGISFLGALLLLFVVREPKHNQYLQAEESDENLLPPIGETDGNYQSIPSHADEEPPQLVEEKPLTFYETVKVVSSDKVMLILFLAAPLRFLGGFAIGTFLPSYYSRRFPDQGNIYATLNAIIVSVGGASSSYLGGFLTDKLSARDERARGFLPALASLLGLIPFIGVLYASNFYVSVGCLFLEYLIAESWFGPALSVMQTRVAPKARGTAISMFLFLSSMTGSLAPALLGHLDADGGSYEKLQKLLMLFVSISYISSALCFIGVGFGLRIWQK